MTLKDLSLDRVISKLPYESKQSPQEKNVMLKSVQSQRQDVKSHLEKSPIALTCSRIVEGVTESKRSFTFLTSKKNGFVYKRIRHSRS